jgi:uncharacterized membrane protein YdjX (TVP38/TMEM64 family)
MAEPAKSKKTMIVRVLLAILVLAALALGGRALKQSGLLQAALEWLAGMGWWAPIIFFFIYLACMLLCLPASLLTLGAGLIWGFQLGVIYVHIAAFVSSIVCFIVSRHFGRGWVAPMIERHPSFKVLDDAVAREGWKVVALVRLAPVFPFAITSYGFGLTRVPLWQYALCSVLIIPGTSMYVYFGSLAGDLSGLKASPPMPVWVRWTIAACALAVMMYLGRFTRRALKRLPASAAEIERQRASGKN